MYCNTKQCFSNSPHSLNSLHHRISDLGRSLSEEALENRYCREVFSRLAELQQYMKSVGPHVMSQNKLIEVLATLYPWQLDSPEVTRAIEVCICHNYAHIIYGTGGGLLDNKILFL